MGLGNLPVSWFILEVTVIGGRVALEAREVTVRVRVCELAFRLYFQVPTWQKQMWTFLVSNVGDKDLAWVSPIGKAFLIQAYHKHVWEDVSILDTVSQDHLQCVWAHYMVPIVKKILSGENEGWKLCLHLSLPWFFKRWVSEVENSCHDLKAPTIILHLDCCVIQKFPIQHLGKISPISYLLICWQTKWFSLNRDFSLFSWFNTDSPFSNHKH